MDAGLLLLRVTLGVLMAAHGSQKLVGWFGGYGIDGTGQFFEALGFRPGRFFAAAAGAAETTGGALVALGWLGPIGGTLVLSVMIVAAISVHWQHGLFAATNGIEVPVLYAAGATALAVTGYGAYSLDALLGLNSLWTPEVVLGSLAAGIIAGVVNLAIRRPAPQQVTA
jgi:putative oxidoreductase